MNTIEIPLLDEELQRRFENWLTNRGNLFDRVKSCKAETFTIYVANEQDAFLIGCNYVTLTYKLFDGPLTTTLG
jgi:hypothetical protein